MESRWHLNSSYVFVRLLKTTNEFTSTYYPPTYGLGKRYYRMLKNMLLCYVNGILEDWDTYASTLTNTSNSQVHRFTKTNSLDLVLYRRILDVKLQNDVCTEKSFIAAIQLTGFLSTLPHSSDCTRVFIQRIQKCYKQGFYLRLRK